MSRKKLSSEQRAVLVAQAVNTLKQNGFNNFTHKELGDKLKSMTCPYSNVIASMLIDAGLIFKTPSKQYKWHSPDPIHFKILQVKLDNMSCLQTKVKFEIPAESKITVEEAVAFLKEKGYKLQKPVVSYEEI